jgi:hypothetical protein
MINNVNINLIQLEQINLKLKCAIYKFPKII